MSASASSIRSDASAFRASVATGGSLFAWEAQSQARTLAVVDRFLAGDLDAPGLRAALGADQATTPRGTKAADGVAVIPLIGVLTPGPSFFEWLGMGTNVRAFTSQVRAAVIDPAVKAIVIPTDSAGGSVKGIAEAASAIRTASGIKPVMAAVSGLAASAAYWIASNASTIAAAPSADVGAIGVIAHRVSVARALERDGVDVNVITAGKYKAEGCEALPMSDAEREHIQRRVDEVHGQFVADVAAGRHTTPANVRERFGEGRLVSAATAKSLGMTDDIASLDDVIARAIAYPQTRDAFARSRTATAPGVELTALQASRLARAERVVRRTQLRLATSRGSLA